MGFGGLMLIGAQTLAAPPQSQSILMRRQMADLPLTKRMSADRNLSYNDARKGCQDRLQPAKEEVASNSPVPTAVKETP